MPTGDLCWGNLNGFMLFLALSVVISQIDTANALPFVQACLSGPPLPGLQGGCTLMKNYFGPEP